jgi:hypothetical protein
MKRALILVLILALLLIGCQPGYDRSSWGQPDQHLEADAIQENIDSAIEEGEQAIKELEEATLPDGKCKPQWKCISSKTKAFQEANCEFTQKTRCDNGCENSTCFIPEAKVCTAGFKCVNNFTKGYQLESCKFTDKTDCDFRCENNKCIPKPENYTEPEVEPAPIPVYKPKIIKMGEELEVDSHTLKINLVEADQVKLAIDGKGSNWLAEGENFTVNGLTIQIKGIYFQAYDGGKQEIEYEVS